MAHQILTVKFTWQLRRSLPNPEQDPGCSKTAKYIQTIKATKPEKYKEHLERDRERAKRNYIKIENLTQDQKSDKRMKWNEAKKSQRKQKTGDETSSIPETKHVKDMSTEEKRAYFAMRKRIQRKIESSKKKKVSKLCAKISECSTSQATMYRKVKVIKEKMPESPNTYAKIVDQLVTKVTPKKQSAIRKVGVVKRNLFLNSEKGENNENYTNQTSNEQAQDQSQISKSKVTKKPLASINVMARYLLAKALKENKFKYKDVKPFGVTTNMFSKKNKKSSPNITITRKRRGLPKESEDAIKKFWYSISRPLPLKKRVKKRSPLYLLERSYTSAYKDFKTQHKDTVGYVTFVKLKPKNVRTLKPNERIVCCCIKCENIKCTLNALNGVVGQVDKGLRIDSERQCSDISVCCYKEFPEKECLDRKCENCGLTNIKKHYQPVVEAKGNVQVPINRWKYVTERTMVNNKEKVKKSVQLVTKTKLVKEVVDDLCEDVNELSGHLFRAKWQQTVFVKVKEDMPAKTAIMVLDFAENYACGMQNEVQSHHWALGQVTIHPIVAFINESDVKGPATKSESMVFISNDLKHDSAANNFHMHILLTVMKLYIKKKD